MWATQPSSSSHVCLHPGPQETELLPLPQAHSNSMHLTVLIQESVVEHLLVVHGWDSHQGHPHSPKGLLGITPWGVGAHWPLFSAACQNSRAAPLLHGHACSSGLGYRRHVLSPSRYSFQERHDVSVFPQKHYAQSAGAGGCRVFFGT